MTKLTYEEAEELYGNVPLLFSSYYKYVFTYVGEASDGARIILGHGGDSDDVYRYNVERDKPVFFKDGYASVTIRKDTETIFEDDKWF